ncbi:hypothetical protein HPP92_018528 [Vanilla planifolia]|uniref:Small nuclear ribonucleoprotein E n=1 Tax=Vanilla planifolia TaxID=51239 RepID=A0A835Q8Y9_VANPL|nr:hypothetical protein HPP92_018528 [Vanilla planifolia]
MATTKVQRIMTQPINLIFRFLQSKARIQIWLFEQKDLRIEGRIIGFDEYMNLVLDDADEVNIKKNTRKPLVKWGLEHDIWHHFNVNQEQMCLIGRVGALLEHGCVVSKGTGVMLRFATVTGLLVQNGA